MSVKYDLLKDYYVCGLWNAERIQNAVGKWITQEESNAILAEVAND